MVAEPVRVRVRVLRVLANMTRTMKTLAAACCTLAAVALLSACSSHSGRPDVAQPPPTTVDRVVVTREIVYTPQDWPQKLSADVYRPAGEGPFPAVVVVHGGGWEGRTRADMAKISEALAERGFVAMNVSYRFAPKFHFPAQHQDISQAVVWLRAHAGEHNVRTDRVATWGYSAGAHLAALVGTTGPGDRQFVDGARVQAVVAGGTPVDVRYYKGGALTKKLLGVPYTEDPELWREASPIAFVTPDDPPMFLYHGSVDFTVGVRNAYAMRDALTMNNVPVELYLLRGREHLSTAVSDAPVEEALAFLDRVLR